MNGKLKVVFLLVLSGVLLGISPVTRLYSAADDLDADDLGRRRQWRR